MTDFAFSFDQLPDEDPGPVELVTVDSAQTVAEPESEGSLAAHIDDILAESLQRRSSDIHLRAGLPPMVRVDGHLEPTTYPVLSPEEVERLIYGILNNDQIAILQHKHELDFSYSSKELGRFRANVYRQRGTLSVALRAVPYEVPSFESLKLPPVVRELSARNSGFVIVTGPTGAGKSTTIASMIDHINQQRPVHIVTIEDPIEYLHRDKMAMVTQREMHTDTASFNDALRAVLREDPDVILVGEMRDLETISAALTLAETGHLVFGTLHTRSAAQTIDRIVDVFPPHQQGQVKAQLANNLLGVVSQLLVPMQNGGRVAAVEVMTATGAIKNLVREGKTHLIPNTIETSESQGMVLMDRSLASLHIRGQISLEEARARAIDPETFDRYLKEL